MPRTLRSISAHRCRSGRWGRRRAARDPRRDALEHVRRDVGLGHGHARAWAGNGQVASPLRLAGWRAYPITAYLGRVRVGVLTGGGDCPGLNAVIRAIVRKGVGTYGHEFVGYRDGWHGPLEGVSQPLEIADVRGILPRGGTILGSSRTNPTNEDDGIATRAGDPRARRRRRPDRDRRRGHPWGRHPPARRTASMWSGCRRRSTTTSAPPTTPSGSTPRSTSRWARSTGSTPRPRATSAP